MKSIISKGATLGFTVLFTGFAVFTTGQGTGEKAKAEDKGKALFEKTCTMCHGPEKATDLRQTKDQWQKTVESMINDKKADIKKDDVAPIVDYLTGNFGIKLLAEEACGGCHPYDGTVTEKRGSKDDWTDTVDRMVARGAYMTKDQTALMIDFLSKSFPDK